MRAKGRCQVCGRPHGTIVRHLGDGRWWDEQRQVWRALIATLEGLLRLHHHPAGSLVALDEYLYQRTAGMIGSLSQLVRGAFTIGSSSETPSTPSPITRPTSPTINSTLPIDRARSH